MEEDAAVQAVMMSLDYRSPPEARRTASAFLDSLKARDVHLVAATAFSLAGSNQASEIRHYGCKMLQHLVRSRWEEFTTDERGQMAKAVVDWIDEVAKPRELWVLKSQFAALVAEVARREGPRLWIDMLPALFALSSRGPVHAELVVMMLRWLPEDVTVHNEDLDGERRRSLLKGLTQSVAEILPFLYKILDEHFGAAMSLVHQNELDLAKQHAATVSACLQAIIAYAEWAPLADLAKSGLIEACGFLLGAAEFRLSACEFLKHIASRRWVSDEACPDSHSAMVRVFEALVKASQDILGYSADVESMDQYTGVDFLENLCEAMAIIGSHHFACITGDDFKVSAYLAQMLGFFRHPKLSVHSQALPLWLTLFRDSSSVTAHIGKAGHLGGSFVVPTSVSGSTADSEKDARVLPLNIPEHCCSVLLEIGFQRLLKKGTEKVGKGVPLQESPPEHFANQCDYGQYRGRMMELIRLIVGQQPFLSATKILELMDAVIRVLATDNGSKDLAVLEGTQVMLETVVSAIPEASWRSSISGLQNMHGNVVAIMEGLLQKLLTVRSTDAALLEIHGRYFVALGPYLKHFPSATPFVIEKLFAVLMGLPICVKDVTMARENSRSRLQVCTSILRFAKSAGSALLPHMQAFAATMTRLRQDGLLHRSELNLLGEALLVVGSVAGPEQEKQVLEWLLGPMRKDWVEVDWQLRFLSNPACLVELFLQDDKAVVGSKSEAQMWSIFHFVTFFERSLRSSTRSAVQREHHPMVLHLQWMLPPLLQLLRCVHALWAQDIDKEPFAHIRNTLSMGTAEQASLLGEQGARPSVGTSSTDFSVMENSSATEDKDNEIRNWLKGVRDSGYNILGLAASRVGDDFFHDADGRAAALASALVENIEAMDFHHIRQLLHMVVAPLVKFCPTSQWHVWLGPIFPPIFAHCHRLLAVSWRTFVQEGVVKIPGKWMGSGLNHMDDGSVEAMNSEVMAEKLLRDLSRETCGLLALISSPLLNLGQGSAEQAQADIHVLETEVGVQPAVSDGLLCFVMKLGEVVAASALGIGMEALDWPDHDSVQKAASFCAQVVGLAVLIGDKQLQTVLSKDLFTAAICGLARESNAIVQSSLIGLLREILVHFTERTAAPWQVLLSLSSSTPESISLLETALLNTSSVKEQRSHIKAYLLAASGDHLRALKGQKAATTITNMTNHVGFQQHGRFPNTEEPGQFGLVTLT